MGQSRLTNIALLFVRPVLCSVHVGLDIAGGLLSEGILAVVGILAVAGIVAVGRGSRCRKGRIIRGILAVLAVVGILAVVRAYGILAVRRD